MIKIEVDKISIEEIEKELGLNKVEPIHGLTPSILKDLEYDGNYFKKMYEDILRAYYENLEYVEEE